jgi:putative copper resistance protein D
MDEALVICRLIHFASVMVVFGGGAFRLYATSASEPQMFAVFDMRLRHLLLGASLVAVLSALLFVPLVGGAMAGSASAALDWHTVSAVMFDTSFGRVWRWHLLIAALLIVVCAIRQVQIGYPVVLSALLLASLGWIGHAADEQGRGVPDREIVQSVHLLASGIWLGGLVPLAALVKRVNASQSDEWHALLRHAVRQFSRMGYAAVTLVALSGVLNTAWLVGSIDGLLWTPYGRLLLLKILLFGVLVAVAATNRLILTPRLSRGPAQSTVTAALLWTVGIEQVLGLGILVAVSVLGTWAPPL